LQFFLVALDECAAIDAVHQRGVAAFDLGTINRHFYHAYPVDTHTYLLYK
jgi:hypothetical protein